jgi:hypothetical protein
MTRYGGWLSVLIAVLVILAILWLLGIHFGISR